MPSAGSFGEAGDLNHSESLERALNDLRSHQIELEMQNEELRRTQADLDAVRARYFDLYDLAPVGYCTVSWHGLILEANLTLAQLLEVPRISLAQQPLSRFIHREDQHSYYLYGKGFAKNGAAQACELRMVKPNGVTLWVRLETTIAEDAHGASLRRTVVIDISERKRAEDSLAAERRRREEALADLFENAPVAYHELDRDGCWRG